MMSSLFKFISSRSQSQKITMIAPLQTIDVNVYLERCRTLDDTAYVLREVYENNDVANIRLIRENVYEKLYDFVNKTMTPSFDEIDAMLLVCKILLNNKQAEKIDRFILNCPYKFVLTYSNNSETIDGILRALTEMELYNICTYLINHIHESKMRTLVQRAA